MSSLASPGASRALRTRCTRRSEFVTVPSDSHQEAEDGEDDVGELGRLRHHDVLDDQEVELREELAGAADVGLRLRRVLADHVERAELAALHPVEHLGEVPAVLRRDRRTPRGLEASRASASRSMS